MPTSSTRKRPLLFMGVGIINTLLDFGFYTFLTMYIFTNDSNIAAAGLISGTFALACAFTTHSLVTWRDTPRTKGTLLRFIVFTGFGMWAIRPLLLTIFINLTPLYRWCYSYSEALQLPLSYTFIANSGAFGLMIIVVLAYNYFTYDRFVFSSKK